jgi:diadenylate cyclase
LDPSNVVAQLELTEAVRSTLERALDHPVVTFIEFALIGAVVYALLRFLQGTRGARLVQAVLLIFAVSFALVRLVAQRFELDRINVLYPYFILGVFLAALVAFQAELRRFLIRLGEGRWLRWWEKETVQAIEPVVNAIGALAKRKVGALIAIERSTEIGGVVDTGVQLDAVVTAELLQTIFWPGSALHDLGVIIRRGRIVAAGCQFPLAESAEVDRALGSRHRAAVGMSHEADAVVIVVSEETGTISVALAGRLRRSLNPSSLQEVLQAELTTKSRAKRLRKSTSSKKPATASAASSSAGSGSATVAGSSTGSSSGASSSSAGSPVRTSGSKPAAERVG